MANITPTPNQVTSGCVVHTWETLTQADTALPILPNGTEPLAGNIQVTGTIGGATVTLQGSNDGTNWVGITDNTGAAISFTNLSTESSADFSSSMVYFRPSATGGAGQDLDITVVLRG